MDKWNRDGQNLYTDMNAQRRHRRKPDQASPEKADVRTAPEAEEEPKARYNPDMFRRPVVKSEPEIPAEPETPVETETTDTPEEPAVPEKVSDDLPDVNDTPEESADSPAVPAADTKEESPAAEAKEETPSAAQEADSRVPPEARRMAAAPYGTARPEARRPGTRPQVAPPRKPIQTERPVNPRPRPRPQGSMNTNARNTAPERNQGRSPRVRVGYAPGRMSDDMTQQIPTQEAIREQLYSRDAKAYLEKRSQPFRTENSSGAPEQDRPEHKLLRIVVALLIVAGLVMAGVMILRNKKNRDATISRQAPRVVEFNVGTATEGLHAPADLNFTVTTEKDVDAVRLYADGDRDLKTDIVVASNTDAMEWSIKLHMDSGFDGTVTLQLHKVGEDLWYNTEYTTPVHVIEPLAAVEPMEDTSGGEPENPADGEVETGEPGAEPYDGTDPEEDDDYYDPDAEAAKAAEESEDELTGEEDPAEGTAAGDEDEPEDEPEGDPEGEPEEGPEGESADEPDEDMPVLAELRTVEPTATPAPETPKPTATPAMTVEAAAEADPGLITSTTVYTSNTKKEKAYSRPAKELIHMPDADNYYRNGKKLGVLTFRGDNFRRNAAIGTLKGAPTKLSFIWEAESGSARGTNTTYYGYGWTGQPVISLWSKEVRTGSNLFQSKQETSGLKEVIIAGLDGNIRFLDLRDGSITRNSIKLGYPMRGTPSVHPGGTPFMSVGQFARKMKVKTGKIGLRQYNLYTQKELKLLDGLDGKYHRPLNDVGSFETSALIDWTTDTLITAGSNGMLYLEALNTNFDYVAKVMSISPSITVMTSKAKGQKNTALTAVESSLAAYDKYVFYADMGGILRCVDTDFLKPVWAVDTGDSVMAAIALDLTEKEDGEEEEPEPTETEGEEPEEDSDKVKDNRKLSLYTANMLNNRKKGDSNIQIRRYDALSGKQEWSVDIGVHKGKKDKDDVGAKASPVIGQHNLSDLVYFTVTGLSDDGRSRLGLSGDAPAALIALEKETGKIVWAFGLSSRSESSPIAVYDVNEDGWIIQCEQNGKIHLLNGRNGSLVDTYEVKAEIEASPAAYDDTLVIGTTGKGTSYVYGIRIETGVGLEEEAGNEENSGGA